MNRTATFAYVSLSCLTGLVFWISLAASIQMDYAITEFTFREAVSRAANASLSAILQDNNRREALWFLVSLFTGIVAPHFHRPLVRVVLLVVALIFASIPFTPFVAILGPALPRYLLQASDGETWGEAWPAMSAVGLWMLITLCYIGIQLLMIIRAGRRRTSTKNHSGENKPQPGVVADLSRLQEPFCDKVNSSASSRAGASAPGS